MKKSDLLKIVKEAITEVKQENLNENPALMALGRVAATAAGAAAGEKLVDKIFDYDEDPNDEHSDKFQQENEINEEDAMIQRGKNVYNAIVRDKLQNLFKTLTRGTEFPSKYNPKDSDMQVKLNKFAVDYKRAGGDLNVGFTK